MRLIPTVLSLLLPLSALAIPAEIPHQGRLFDADGAPLDGAHRLTFALYDSAQDGAPLWTESQELTFDAGYFATRLGTTTALDTTLFARDALWLGIAVDDGGELPARLSLGAVPYALQAGTAKNVDGGSVNATSIAVNGAPLLGDDGTLAVSVAWDDIVGAPEPEPDTLAALTCTSGQIPRFDGASWACADDTDHGHDAGDLTTGTLAVERLPIGTSTGSVAAGDHGHDAAAITSGTLAAARLPIGTGADQAAAGDHKHAAADLTSGTIDIARLPVGTGANQVMPGNKTFTAADVGALPATGGTLSGALTVNGALAAGAGTFSSSVKIGANTATCTSALAGSLRWATDTLELCIGTAWVPLASAKDGRAQARAAASCDALLTAFPSTPDGAYWIDPDGGDVSNAVELYCDMTRDGGGWTQVFAIINGQPGQPAGTGTTNVAALKGAYPTSAAKLSDADINRLAANDEYRHVVRDYNSYKRFYKLSHDWAWLQTGLVRSGDSCKRTESENWIAWAAGPTTNMYGLASTTDGCGGCVDYCGGGNGTGSWTNWAAYFGISNNGSYAQQGVNQYTNGWIFVR